MNTQAILFEKPGQAGFGEVEIPAPGPGQLLLKTLFSCISPGTEMRCLNGAQARTDSWPFIPGYSTCAEVIEAGEGAQIAVGTRVRCNGTQAANLTCQWGGHIAHQIVSEGAVQVVPDACDSLDASISRIAAIAYHGIVLARPRPHEKVAVVGLGPIGQFAARCHHLSGAHVVGVDIDPRRVDLLRQVGVDAAVAGGPLGDVIAPFFPDGVDILVDATGFPPVMREAVGIMRALSWDPDPGPGPQYIIQGSYAGDFEMPYDPAFMNELTIRLPRDCAHSDMAAVMDFIARKRLQVRDLITEVASPRDAGDVYTRLAEKGTPLMTVAFDWSRV